MSRVRSTICVVFVCVLWGCAGCILSLPPGTSRSEQSNGPGNIPAQIKPLDSSDSVLHGIRLGMSAEDAKHLLDTPVSGRSPDGDEYWRQGEHRGISFYHKNGVVWFVSDSIGSTPRGVKIGDSSKRITELYGNPTEMQKYGWWLYKGNDGFTLILVVRDDQVQDLMIENESLRQSKPSPDRESETVGDPQPFGSQDYSLAGVEACSRITHLRADSRFEETRGSAERGTHIGFVTTDGYMRVDPATSGSSRVDSVQVSGGSYETARGVRVGDPITRAEAMYGKANVQDDNVALDFWANVNGRIESIALRCLRAGPP